MEGGLTLNEFLNWMGRNTNDNIYTLCEDFLKKLFEECTRRRIVLHKTVPSKTEICAARHLNDLVFKIMAHPHRAYFHIPGLKKLCSQHAEISHLEERWRTNNKTFFGRDFVQNNSLRKEVLDELFQAIDVMISYTPGNSVEKLGSPPVQIGDSSPPRDDDDQILFDTQDGKELVAIRERRGQPKFRKKLIEVYEGKCAVTGCDVREALDAAHIRPVSESKSDDPRNGILLRSDVHNLFDLGLIGFDTSVVPPRLLLHERLMHSEYASLSSLRLPSVESSRPSKGLLDEHRQKMFEKFGKDAFRIVGERSVPVS